MKIISLDISAKKIIAFGLLLVVVPLLVNDFYSIPHFLRGLITGVGLGIEITGFIKLKREKSMSEYKNTEELCSD